MQPKDDEIVVYNEDGEEYLMNILFTYESERTGGEYVFIYDKANPDDVILMKYNEEHELFEVTNEDELEEAQEILDTYNDDPLINEIK